MRSTWIILLLFSLSCDVPQESTNEVIDPLASWNDGVTKMSILHFIDGVVNPESEHFVHPADRIAVFDNDGTLWPEQPFYFQLFFTLDRVRALADAHPEWQDTEPFKAVLEGDMGALLSQGEHGLLQMVLATHSGVSPEQFETEVRDWLTTAKHPRFNRPFTDLVYRPMLELIDLLKKNGFKVFIVSGGGIEFMRPWVEEVYGISKEHVIGSYLKMSYSNQENTPLILSLPEIEHINDKEGKVLGIQRHIGRKPIFVAGNSDGDLQMMQWADFQEGDQFILTVHHTDSVREWAYDRNSSIGRLDKVLEESVRNDWIQADIMNDWKYVYAFELAN